MRGENVHCLLEVSILAEPFYSHGEIASASLRLLICQV